MQMFQSMRYVFTLFQKRILREGVPIEIWFEDGEIDDLAAGEVSGFQFC